MGLFARSSGGLYGGSGMDMVYYRQILYLAEWHPERSEHIRRIWYNIDRYYTLPNGIQSGAGISEGYDIMSANEE